ncbi:hypothetical protein [Pontibacter chitinilyticus]|uniref:hypothetical protein n=1 Tax=Pontibacter chitinilyticus TaxID=2674989 RepID=UPI0032197FAB
MKTLLFSLLLLFSSLAANAQQTEPTTTAGERLYVGVGLTSISYHIYYKGPQLSGFLPTGYFAPVAVNLGYWLNERASIQIGAAYGGSKDKGSWSDVSASGEVITHDETSKTRAVAVPVTGRFVFFKVYKRFPLYGTATLLSAWGFTQSSTAEAKNGGTPTIITEHYKGINVFATAGVGFNYKISNRFTGYVEVLPFKYNLNGHNSFYHDWERYATKDRRFYKSFSVGVNYSL